MNITETKEAYELTDIDIKELEELTGMISSVRKLVVQRNELQEFKASFTDTTPLSELTPEQWEGLEFENDNGRWLRRIDAAQVFLLLTVDPGSCVAIYLMEDGEEDVCYLGSHIKTLGQLRHLIAALEW